VMLMGNVVGLSQMITSIEENLTIKPIRYQQQEVRHALMNTGCRGHPCPRKRETHGGFHIKSSEFFPTSTPLRRARGSAPAPRRTSPSA
jgi:hypothetical protein